MLNPYLSFKDNCREAMEFYKGCLGGKLTMMTFGESPMAAKVPEPMHNNIMHSVLQNDGFMLMASDMMEPGESIQGTTISLCLSCKTKEELEASFKKLSAGGKVVSPLQEFFFGTLGNLVDKFGFRWMCEMHNEDMKM